jgi:hypothetical protein
VVYVGIDVLFHVMFHVLFHIFHFGLYGGMHGEIDGGHIGIDLSHFLLVHGDII